MSTYLHDLFRDNVRSIMDRDDWTTADLAEAAGMSASYLSQLMNGHRNPGFESLEAIAEALGVDPSELISKKMAKTS